jgi:four helix bundle protein
MTQPIQTPASTAGHDAIAATAGQGLGQKGSGSGKDWGAGVETLECYHLSLVLAAEAVALVPRGHAGLRDQIERATASVPLNAAEGWGRWQPREKSHHYAIARGSALETAAAVDLLAARGLAPSDECQRVSGLARRVALMLGGLIRSMERRANAGR